MLWKCLIHIHVAWILTQILKNSRVVLLFLIPGHLLYITINHFLAVRGRWLSLCEGKNMYNVCMYEQGNICNQWGNMSYNHCLNLFTMIIMFMFIFFWYMYCAVFFFFTHIYILFCHCTMFEFCIVHAFSIQHNSLNIEKKIKLKWDMFVTILWWIHSRYSL